MNRDPRKNFDELSRHAPNVAGAQEDEVIERVFA
jgi:hypothetical protein